MDQRVDELREIAIEGFFVAALDEYFVFVAKDERAKAIPLWLDDPCVAGRIWGRQFIDSLCEHGQQRRVDRKAHASWYTGGDFDCISTPWEATVGVIVQHKEQCRHHIRAQLGCAFHVRNREQSSRGKRE